MRGNKKRDTRPELLVRRWLLDSGTPGYRLHWQVPGRPDIAYPEPKIAIFVQGCFWHGCERCRIQTPRYNGAYWADKIARNRARDKKNLEILRTAGWLVLELWECDARNRAFNSLRCVVEMVKAHAARKRDRSINHHSQH
jgi:DNA mismatch endonuclease (patch repair protein)